MDMSQTRHKTAPRRFSSALEGLGRGTPPWRASAHRLLGASANTSPTHIEACPGATWKRENFFSSYKPVAQARDPEAGAHVTFSKLREALASNEVLDNGSWLLDKALVLFANKYGLLGLFWQNLSAPILPQDSFCVAPDAVIEGGKLRGLDAATEGKRLLEDLLYERHGPSVRTGRIIRFGRDLTLPPELRFSRRSLFSPFRRPDPLGGAVVRAEQTWDEAKVDYGCHLVLDKHASSGVSLLTTREPVPLLARGWEFALENFPGGLNDYLADVSPYAYIGESGGPERGWHCSSLLQAMYLMYYLDITGGREIYRCQASGCGNYYRAGPQSRSMYCSERCASRASTRRTRGQAP